jgi:hypothetical protein
MSLTELIEAYVGLSTSVRVMISLFIGLLCYIGLRLLIRSFNKSLKQTENKKERGNYWERMERNARVQMS